MFSTHAHHAFLSLFKAKLRSFLAILGILIGSAAVVALLSCGRLATEKALLQIKALGTELLAFSAFSKSPQGKNAQQNISLKIWRQIPSQVEGMVKIAPYALAFQPLSYQGKTLSASLVAADENLADILKVQLAAGHFVSSVDHYEHFCVIGQDIAQQMKAISLKDPLGQPLRIGRVIYTVIGIAKPWAENYFFNENINQSVIIPLGGLALVTKETHISHAVALLAPAAPIEQTLAQVQKIVQAYAPALSLFSRSAKQLIQSMEGQAQIFHLLLGVIGCISLIVGGIGIMNIMLVSVNERKREIGIRKAIGASQKDIQLLFLIEAALLTLTGGSLGVLIGLILSYAIAYAYAWPFHIYFLPIFAGFVISLLSGLFFGWYPAKRAAQLEPITCLRQE